MAEERWLAANDVLPDGSSVSGLYVRGERWQLYTTKEGGYALAVRARLHQTWLDRDWLEPGLFMETGEDLLVWCAPAGSMISSVEHGPYPSRREQAEAFLQTLLRTRERFGRVSFGDALYIAQFSVLLPTFTGIQGQDDARVLGRWLTGGVNIPVTDTERVRRYAPWLTEGVLSSILARLDLTADAGAASVIPTMEQEAKAAAAIAPRRERAEGPFCLSGRPALERFIREELLHVIDNEEAYRRMGVGFPGAVLLYGPPGCGKTYAVDQLAEYLGWPVYRVTSGTIGSKYVHETSKKVSEVFDQAIANAPSVIIIDELEAFLSSRESARGAGEIHMEEVAEFLRRIPDAAKNRVLLFGMTNMLDSIDKAILRRGRFDHIIEVGMPSTQEVRSLLEGMLEKIPTTGDLRLDALARRLTGRQIADVAFVVKEAGRLAVRCGRASVDAKLLETACDGLCGDTKPKRRMGFD